MAGLVIVKRMRRISMVVRTLSLALVTSLGCAADKPGSIGAHLSRDNETGAVYVRDLFPGLAGEKAGILPGDEIIMIDGHYVRQMEASRVREALRGQVGTAVHLTLIRGELVVRVKVARSELRDVQDAPPKPRIETLKE